MEDARALAQRFALLLHVLQLPRRYPASPLLDAPRVPRAAVLGVSAGAPSAMQLALRHPDRVTALVLLVPAVSMPQPDGAAAVHSAPGTGLLFDTQ